jgi:Fe-S oxidoreductase
MGSAFGAVASVVNPVLGTFMGRVPLAAIGVDPARNLPRYERESLETWFRRRGPVRVTPAAGGAPWPAVDGRPGAATAAPAPANVRDRAALFVDCFVNHNLPEVGKVAVELLERAGVEVVLAHNSCCGRPAMSQGDLAHPRAWAVANLGELGRLIDEGYDIVCVEPSCLSALRDDYRRLLETTPLADEPRIAALEQHSFDVTEYLLLRAREGRLRLRLGSLDETFIVHGHCHQKSLGLGSVPAELLRLVPGATVVEVEALCCGLVGSFGYKAEYSALSRAIGAQLFDRIGEHEGQVVACGVSCRSQIEHGTGRPVVHPVEVLHRALA